MKYIDFKYLIIHVFIVIAIPVLFGVLLENTNMESDTVNLGLAFLYSIFLVCYIISGILILIEGLLLYVMKKWKKGNACMIAGILNIIAVFYIHNN